MSQKATPTSQSRSVLPSTMKSWVVAKMGAPATALQLLTDVTVPASPAAGADILIKVSYAALNPADVHYMSRIPTILPFRRRPVPGLDFCGAIVSLGPSVVPDSGLAIGTVVCGAVPASRVATGTGTLAEYISVPYDSVRVKPDSLSDAEAAGLGIAGQTAMMIYENAKIQKGHRVLINGASGGVGSFLCQIVNGRGGEVYAICSAANEEMMLRLGAKEVIDYKTHDPVHEYLASRVKEKWQFPFDVVIDCVGSQVLYDKCSAYLGPSGIFISIVGGASEGVVPWLKGNLWPSVLGGTPRKYKILGLLPKGSLQDEVVESVKQGHLKEIPIDSEFSMEDVLQAYERVASKRSRGKVVVKVDSSKN